MKKLIGYIMIAALITAGTALTGLAHGKIHTTRVTLEQNTMVGGTQIDKGSYILRFNEQTGDLEVQSESGRKLIATVRGKVIEGQTKSPYTEVEIDQQEHVSVMTGLRIEGLKKQLSFESPETAASGNGQDRY